MKFSLPIASSPFTIQSDKEFNAIALELFHYQYRNCSPYQTYLNHLKIDPNKINSIDEIPYLPIDLFKQHNVYTLDHKPELIFKSSGTTSQLRSTHRVAYANVYQASFRKTFELFFGKVSNYTIIALLPNYLEQGESSLVYMVNTLIEDSKNTQSGFYLDKLDSLTERLKQFEKDKQVLLIGVSYALLDALKHGNATLTNTTIIETGGMKGRRKEMIREELHTELKKGYGVNHVYSEYGMTELLSQAYLTAKNRFQCPPWMRIRVRDTNDPLSSKFEGKGGINVIDLANIYSCSFIATQDLGEVYADGTFDVQGRFDNSDIRGCNLMVI